MQQTITAKLQILVLGKYSRGYYAASIIEVVGIVNSYEFL